MNIINRIHCLTTLAAAAMLAGTLTGTAAAAPILCQDPTKNHMLIDSTEVSDCLASGSGNINGNPMNDPWLTNGGTAAGYTLASKDDAANPYNIMTTQTGDMGTWSIDASFWDTYTDGALAFKFGTGNQADAWFVFDLIYGVTSGNWKFVNVFGKGGGLSHTNLYSANHVPEPGTLTLLGLSLFGLAISRRMRAV